MKRIWTIFLLTLLSAPSVSPAQVNSYFLNNPVWQVRSSFRLYGTGNEQYLRNEFFNYYVKGDTLIDSLVYKKVYRKGKGSYTDMMGFPISDPAPYQYVLNSPSYFLRSAGKKVFSKKSGQGESLLYDFDLVVGGSLPITAINTTSNITVVSIDSVYTPFGYRKKFVLSGVSTSTYLLEGIGHQRGLVEYMGTMMDGGFYLECFSMNDTAYFPSSGPTCNMSVGLASEEKQMAASVFPNPFATFTTLHFSSILKSAQLSIYNQFGQPVRFSNDHHGDKIRIERGSLTPGLYLYEVKQEGVSVAMGKLIIAE